MRARRRGRTATASCCRPGMGRCCSTACLYLTGYSHMTIDEIKRFRQLGSRTEGHPEYGHAPGIETTTGPLGQGLGERRRHGDRRGEPCRPLRSQGRRPPHLGHRRRRLPDGGDQPRGDRPRRKAAAEPADRDVGRQRHLDRRQGQPRRRHRPEGALRGRRLVGARVRRPRSGRYRPGAHRCEGVGPAGDDRLPHPYRLRRADQAGHQGGARLAARRRRDCEGPRGLRLALPALRGARRDHRCLARDRGEGRRGARGLGGAARQAVGAEGAPNSPG